MTHDFEASAEDSANSLAARLHAADATVLQELLDGYGPSVINRLRSGFRPELSEDDIKGASLAGLFNLWESRASYDPCRSSLGDWFYWLSRNALVDIRRQRKRQLPAELVDQVVLVQFRADMDTDSSDAESPPSTSQLVADTKIAWSTLPERDRVIVEAYFSSDDPRNWASAAARPLGMTNNAVRVRFARIKQRIRLQLQLHGHCLSIKESTQ